MSYFQYENFSEDFLSLTYTKLVKKNEKLFSLDEDVYGIFCVKSGTLKMIAYPDLDQSIVLYRASENQIFGEEHLFLDHYTYDAVAEEDTVVLVFPKQHFLKEIDKDQEARVSFMSCISKRYYNLRINMERMAIPSAKDRVFHLLRTLSVQEGKSLNLKGRVRGLSDDLNLTHESVYRAMKQLEDDGKIVRDDGFIQVL